MKILVVGGGGREHAIIRALKKSPECTEIWCAPGNGGISYDAACRDIPARDVKAMTAFAKEEGFDYVVVAQDDPLALGMVDSLKAVGIPAFGPDQAAARIESSKVFSKHLMEKYGIPTAAYQVFDDPAEVLAYVRRHDSWPAVIKADGLALGKGVLICRNLQEAEAAVQEIMLDRKFGDSGRQVVVEEFLEGPEVSVLAFCDGTEIKPMVSSMDHKRALDHDEGLNTGGMGAIAPSPFYTKETAEICMERIFLPTVKAMAAEECPFRGCLYFGLMLTEDGPKVIEYNCRFGDPETQAVLPLLKSDLLEIMMATTNGTLRDTEVEFSDQSCACVILASGGYPLSYKKGMEIHGLSNGQLADHPEITVYHAGTALKDGRPVTAGGRVLGVTALGDTLKDALDSAYRAADEISFEGMHRRSDIGARALACMAAQERTR